MATGPFGSSIGSKTFRAVGVPVIRGSNLSADVGKRLVEDDFVFIEPELATQFMRSQVVAGDLVFTCWGTINQVGLIGQSTHYDRYVISNKQMKFTADTEKVLPLFLYYWFSGPEGQAHILGGAIGSSVPGFNLGQLRLMRVPLPSLDEQGAIASVLGALDDKIDLNRRMNETLEAMARAMFKDWFLDFGPTRAKMEGGVPYLAPEIWSLFPDLQDNEGKPQGWRTEPLLQHARLISGGTPRTEIAAYWNGPIAWASAKDVSQCSEMFLIDTDRTITERGLNESATRIVPKLATIVVARGATTGRFCMFGREIAMNQTCYALASTHGRAFWLNCAFASLVESLVHAAHGSVFDTITTNTIEGARATISNPALLDHFEAAVLPLFSRVLANIEESETLGATRNLLLPKLMSGEIRVRDAEKIAEAAQ